MLEMSERRKRLAIRVLYWIDILLTLTCFVLGGVLFWQADGPGYDTLGGKLMLLCGMVFLFMALMVKRHPVFAIVLHFLFLILLLSL